MSEEEIRIKVAELCGYRVEKVVGLYSLIGPDGKETGPRHFCEYPLEVYAHRIPNYTQSLDACATFEAGIDDRQWSNALTNVIRDHPHWTSGAVEARYRTAKATPLERCEAFLKLNRKWVAS